jgi:cytochrome c biogenesis protein CcmG, thiol:disulfide interchange protein DsbE
MTLSNLNSWRNTEMSRFAFTLTLTVALLGTSLTHGDDFKREGSPAKRALKDPLEGKAPPPLQVTGWLNTKDNKPLKLADLKGKVIILDFWGVW